MSDRKRPSVLTPRRRAACRANLEKGGRRFRTNALRHGLFARDLRHSVIRLGEDVREFDDHLRRVERFFAPQDDAEKTLVRHLAEAVWRWFRVYRAEAVREARLIRRLLEEADPYECLSPDEIRSRAFALLDILTNHAPFFRRTDRLRGGLERFVQALLRYRTREKPGFKIFTRERNWDITALLTKCVLTADGFVPRPYGPSLPLPDK